MSKQPAISGHPTTFNTNVNRSKTKKWVEAKSYSYDGDDWGDVDDYDEYGGYDEPEPAPEPKPTGLRQQGQSASHMPHDPYSTRQDPYQSPVDARIHGNIGGPPGRQQQYGSRSVTNPQIQPPGIRKMNSFDPEDERRAFSAGGPPPTMGNTGSGAQTPSQNNQGQNVAARDFQSGQNYPDQRPKSQPNPAQPSVQTPRRPIMDEAAKYEGQPRPQPGNYQNVHPEQPPQPDTGSRTQSMASTNSALDFHNRRDFSPSAMPPPLQTRGSPSPHSRSSPSHPPRKSSLSQEIAPAVPFGAQDSPMTGTGDTENALPPARERTASGAGKALPFVRPADIYRRMQEEKEKERQSQDSARPSMDTIIGKSNEPPDLGSSYDSEAGQRLKPTLDPVTERRSEYGLEGVKLDEQPKPEPEERRPTTSKRFELPKRKSAPGVQGASGLLQDMLPNISRVSGFGESFFGSTSGIGELSNASFMNPAGPNASAPTRQQQQQNQPVSDKDLKNQPSQGFTSAVHEAFDRAEDQVPPTPTSAAGSTVGRSTSGGTSAVSPIISRDPSMSTEHWNAKLPGIEDVTTPTTVHAHEGASSRPLSSSSLGTPKQVTRKPSPSPATVTQATDLPSPSFVPGHRRDLSTPSPDNSPARTPALEVSQPLQQPQEVELAAATPTDSNFSTDNSSNVSEVAEQEPTSAHASGTASRGRTDLQVDTQPIAKDFSGKAEPAGSPIRYPQNDLRTRTDSGSSSRVRDLADKFESGSRPGSAHSSTPRGSVFGYNMQRDDLVPPRPLADRMESFRPHLPGGWESSASIAPAAALKQPEPSVNRTQPSSITTNARPSEDLVSSTNRAPSSVSQIKDASEEAFTAVAAAGTALAGALAAAVGMDQPKGPAASTAETPSDEYPDGGRSQASEAVNQEHKVSLNTVVNPEAAKPHLPDLMEDEASTAVPTPLPKETPLHRPDESASSDYFSSPKDQEHAGTLGRSEGTAPANRPSMLPSLSTDTGTPQYESDRLRREIVRELNPDTSEPTTAQSDYSNYQDASRLSTNQSLPRPGHESGVLPREYESYWNDANSDDNTSHLSVEPGRLEDATTARRQHGAAVVGDQMRPHHVEQDNSAGEPLHLGPEQQRVPSDHANIEEGPQDSPQILQRRFSWEQPLQSPQPIPAHPDPVDEAPDATVSGLPKSVDTGYVREAPDAPMSDFLRSAVYPEGKSFEPKDSFEASQLSALPNAEATLGSDAPRPRDPDTSFFESQHGQGQQEVADIEKDVPGHPHGLQMAFSQDDHVAQVDSGYDDGANQVGQQSPVFHNEQRRDVDPPVAEPCLPGPPVHEPSRPFGAQSDELPPLASPNAQPKITAFREILALRSPLERIRAYDETREQFANLNTGLAHWLATKANELPEHGDLFVDSGRRPAFQAHKPSPSRSKLGGLLQVGGHSIQPYSNSSPSVADAALGNASPYGYSPSAGSSSKISSHQVQAKGKDLLHSAGVFGGKANVAAKGLFSKGKSKLRGSTGAEKAFPLPPQPYSAEPRGMQQQPRSIEERPAFQSAATPPNVLRSQDLGANIDRNTPYHTISPQRDALATIKIVDPELAAEESPCEHVSPNKIAIQNSSPESRPLPDTSGQRSPRDTPSLESFTQSQEGDDERSEESVPTNQEHRPRASSLYLQGITNYRQRRSTQTQVTVGNNAPTFVKETPLQDSHVGSPKEVQTPRSATSSNRTPTQATFDAVQPAIPAGSPAKIDGASIQYRSGTGSPPRSFAQPQSSVSAQILHKKRWSQELEAIPGFPPDSEGAYQKAGGENGLSQTPLPTLQTLQSQMADVNPYSQVSTDAKLPRQSEAFQERSLQSPTNVQSDRPDENSMHPETPLQDHSWRGPSIDSDLGRVNFDHPPSPLTPRQPTNYGASDERGRAGPIHYGIDHDFDRPRGTERSRSRSPSYPLEHQDSRPSLDPNILDHPAFRAVAEGNGMPMQDYHSQLMHKENLPLPQQTAEDMLVGGGPTIGRRPESKSRSRRGSRSSAFFKAFTSPSKSDHPPLPNAPDSQGSSSPRSSPAIGDRRSKRLSIFRPLSGNMEGGSGDSRSKDNMAPDASPQDPLTQVVPQVGPMTPSRVGGSSSSQGASSKWSKKLQRASTSAKPEPDSGKKKRFSAIGTLFGGRKRQNSNPQSQIAPQQSFQQSHPGQMQQRGPHGVVQSQRLEQHDSGPPREEHIQPPREGYYAPSRQDGRPPYSGSRHDERPYSGARDTPAYVQDSALRVRQLMSPIEKPQNAAGLRTSATFPQRSPQHPSSNVPRSSTSTQTRTGEAFPRRSEDQSKASMSSWTRFSAHARSKSRPDQERPPSNGALSSPPPRSYAPVPPFDTPTAGLRPFQGPARHDSPPPPPPPPKDDWLRLRPHDSSSLSPSLSSQQAHHSPTPSSQDASPPPAPTHHQRQSLPPLQTNVHNGRSRNGAIGSGRILTPEEKRKSRQLEIERSSIPPPYQPFSPARDDVPRRGAQGVGEAGHERREEEEDEDEEVPVMSATSFPGQMWQPSYSHWDE